MHHIKSVFLEWSKFGIYHLRKIMQAKKFEVLQAMHTIQNCLLSILNSVNKILAFQSNVHFWHCISFAERLFTRVCIVITSKVCKDFPRECANIFAPWNTKYGLKGNSVWDSQTQIIARIWKSRLSEFQKNKIWRTNLDRKRVWVSEYTIRLSLFRQILRSKTVRIPCP